MSIQSWSNDFASGVEHIDTQHKTLFKLINQFAEENDQNVKPETMVTFLDKLWNYCEYHFEQEEELMNQYDYPLMDYHIDKHKQLKLTVIKTKKQINDNQLKNPFEVIISLTTTWLNNHIAIDDMTFFNYYANRDYDLSKEFAGRQCEILTLNNQLLGVGKITSIQNNNVVIENKNNAIVPAHLNDFVKVSSLSAKRELQLFVAKVFYSTPKVLKLFNATVIKTVNERSYVRVSTDIAATLWLNEQQYAVTIDNISAGGLSIKTDQVLPLEESVFIEFTLLNDDMRIYCKIVRGIKSVDSFNVYGLQFENNNENNVPQDKLMAYVLLKQSAFRQSTLNK